MKRLLSVFLLAACMLSWAFIVSAATVSEPSLLALMQDVKSAIRQAQARYDSGNVTGAADLARKILAKYPDNADAKAILDQCVATEREEYEKAVGSMSVAELTNFQKKYPESEYGIDVSKRIADLPFWLDAKDKNTLDSYKQYLSESIHQMYKRDADDAIAELTVKQAYDAAVAANTIKAFEQFRSKYPDSVYDKQASNKIARLMADKFNSRSTYTDKSNALAFAKNGMTWDYVNNKFNKATRKSNTTSYNSSSFTSSQRTTGNTYSYGTSSSTYSSPTVVKEPSSIRFGMKFYADLGSYSKYDGDFWYSGTPFSLGAGIGVRFGDHRWPLNFKLGVNALYTNSTMTFTYWYNYSHDKQTVTDKKVTAVIPVELNWNMFRGNSAAFFIGVGYHYGIQTSRALKVTCGAAWLKGEWEIYYMKYFKGPLYESGQYSPFIGTGYTYYF